KLLHLPFVYRCTPSRGPTPSKLAHTDPDGGSTATSMAPLLAAGFVSCSSKYEVNAPAAKRHTIAHANQSVPSGCAARPSAYLETRPSLLPKQTRRSPATRHNGPMPSLTR